MENQELLEDLLPEEEELLEEELPIENTEVKWNKVYNFTVTLPLDKVCELLGIKEREIVEVKGDVDTLQELSDHLLCMEQFEPGSLIGEDFDEYDYYEQRAQEGKEFTEESYEDKIDFLDKVAGLWKDATGNLIPTEAIYELIYAYEDLVENIKYPLVETIERAFFDGFNDFPYIFDDDQGKHYEGIANGVKAVKVQENFVKVTIQPSMAFIIADFLGSPVPSEVLKNPLDAGTLFSEMWPTLLSFYKDEFKYSDTKFDYRQEFIEAVARIEQQYGIKVLCSEKGLKE